MYLYDVSFHTLQCVDHVVPVKNYRALDISWLMPSTQMHYRQKPLHLVSHLLGHEGIGSVLSLLKRLGWAIGVWGVVM